MVRNQLKATEENKAMSKILRVLLDVSAQISKGLHHILNKGDMLISGFHLLRQKYPVSLTVHPEVHCSLLTMPIPYYIKKIMI